MVHKTFEYTDKSTFKPTEQRVLHVETVLCTNLIVTLQRLVTKLNSDNLKEIRKWRKTDMYEKEHRSKRN